MPVCCTCTCAHAGGRYGLKHSGAVPDALRGMDLSARAADTRARLEEARLAKEAEERDKAAQKYTRKEYKTGKMTGASCCCAPVGRGEGGVSGRALAREEVRRG